MKLTMCELLLSLICTRSFGEKESSSSFLHSKVEGKMMKTPFPQNYMYILRTTTTHHMVSFIDFCFHFLANFQT